MQERQEIRRSGRKTLAMRVKADGTLLVFAPRRCPQRLIDDFVFSHREWIEKQRCRPVTPMTAKLTEQTVKDLKAAARRELPELIARYGPQADAFPTRVTVTRAATRFGSCSGKNALSFSCRLMMFPREAVEYVVVHELCHIHRKDHGKEFYERVEQILPDWRRRRELLKAPLTEEQRVRWNIEA